MKTVLGITGSTYDARIDFFIPQVEADFLNIRGIAYDIDSNDDIDYPDNAEVVAAFMVGYLLTATQFGGAGMSDKQSESIGSYSYSTRASDDYIYGYPKSIISRIERWHNPK